MNVNKTTGAALAFATLLGAGSMPSMAATWGAVQDTSVYEFLGNLGAPSGDSGGVLVWNHETNHGTQGLISFDSGILSDPLLSGNYKATLNLYAVGGTGGFVQANAGDADADNPYTPGTATLMTDIYAQHNAWSEGGAVTWGDITSTGTPYATITQSGTDQWYSVDITSLVQDWETGGSADFGIALSQEAYGVIRTDSGSIAVSQFCDTEGGHAACTSLLAPNIEVSAVPLPAAVWLFGSALAGLVGVSRRRARTQA